MPERNEIQSELTRLGRERLRLRDKLEANSDAIKPVVAAAREAGIGTSLITRLTGISAACAAKWAKAQK